MKLTQAEWDAIQGAALELDGEKVVPWEDGERILGKERADEIRGSYPGDLPWSGVKVELVDTSDARSERQPTKQEGK